MKKIISVLAILCILGMIFSVVPVLASDAPVDFLVEAENYAKVENFPNGGVVEYASASGGKFIEFSGNNLPEGEYAAVYYNVFVPEAGQYDIEISASDLSSEYLCPWYLRINGGEYFYSARASQEPSTCDKVKNYTVNMTLQAGKNEIVLGVDQMRAAGGDSYILRADYIRFIKTSGLEQGKILEAENYLVGMVDTRDAAKDTNYLFAAEASGGEYVMMNSGKSAEYRIYSPYNGRFHLELSVNGFSAANVASGMIISINGMEYDVSAENTMVLSQYSQNALWGVPMYKISCEAGVALDKGFNQIIISNTSANTKDLYLDYIKFIEMPANISQEAETSADKTSTQKPSSYASGGAYERMSAAEQYTACTFAVKAAGNYTLDMILGGRIADADSIYLGSVKLQIDSGEEMLLSADGTEENNFMDKNCTLGEVAHPDAAGTTDEARFMKHYTLDQPVALSEGTHTIKFINGGGDNPTVFVDKFDFVLNTSAAEAELAVPKNLLAVDEVMGTELFAVSSEGVRVPDEAVNRSYSSSQPAVASVDANGVITAHNPGKAVITAAVETNSGTENITAEVRVVKTVSGTPVVIESAQKVNQTVRVDAFSIGEVSETVRFIAAVYGTENGQRTSLKNVGFVDQNAFALYNISSVSIPIEAEAGDEVVVYVWQSDTLIPVYEAMQIQ